MNKKRILVTGAAGFIGSHLCKKLIDKGYYVVGIDNLSAGFRDNVDSFPTDSFEFIKMDIRDLPTDKNLLIPCSWEAVYHLAAKGETYWCENHPTETVDINVKGTIAVLQWAKCVGVPKFIFADTSAEYDNVSESEILIHGGSLVADADLHPPKGIYSISKNAASRFVRTFYSDHVIFRFFNVYGPSMNLLRDTPPVIGAFISGIWKNGTVTIYGDGTKRRDFIYIDDVINMLLKSIEKYDILKGGTYNAGTGTNYSVSEILDIICALIEKNDVKVLRKPDQIHEAQITLANMKEEMEFFDIQEFIPIDVGIGRTINSHIYSSWIPQAHDYMEEND